MKFVEHFYYIAAAMNRPGQDGMWDEEDGFYYDLLRLPDGSATRLKVRSMVGLLPLCATDGGREMAAGARSRGRWLRNLKRLRRMPELAETIHPTGPGHFGVAERGMIALLRPDRLRRILTKMLDENEFLSPYGIRSLSKFHDQHPYIFHVQGQEYRVDYLPAESNTGMFGGNSNWRGPIWMPVNALIIRALQNFYLYYGDNFKIECPDRVGEDDESLRGEQGDRRPAHPDLHPRRAWSSDPSTAARRNSRPIPTGATTSCSTSTFTATTGQGSAPVTRPAGRGWWPRSSSSTASWIPSGPSKSASRPRSPKAPRKAHDRAQQKQPPDASVRVPDDRSLVGPAGPVMSQGDNVPDPRYPALYQINTRVWLTDLSRALGRRATLDDVPDAELDRLAKMGFDWVWLLSVWQTGPAAQAISRANPGWRREFAETLPDLTDDDIAGSGFAIQSYTVHRDLGGAAGPRTPATAAAGTGT